MTTKRITKFKGAEEEAETRVARVGPLVPLNDNQATYLNALKTCTQVVVTGYSGTGKTFMAASHAADMYSKKQIDKIILTRPNVSVGKDLGYFPGDLNEKFAPWATPVLEVLKDRLSVGVLETGIKNGNIELAPLSVMRGRSFKDAFIILDEAQNTTVSEIKMFLTRIGKNCKVVINGDIRQSDINQTSGLAKIVHLIKQNHMDIPVIEFGVDDIVRSEICKNWIIAFESSGL